MKTSWYEKIDWQPFLWFGCFLALIGFAFLVTENEVAKSLLTMAAGAIAPRIRSSKPEPPQPPRIID